MLLKLGPTILFQQLASATKAGLYDSTGNLLSEGRTEVPLHYPQSDAVEQDMQDFYQSAAVAIRQCMRACNVDTAAVAGLAFDSQMAGIGAVDEDFRPAMRFDSWLDAQKRFPSWFTMP